MCNRKKESPSLVLKDYLADVVGDGVVSDVAGLGGVVLLGLADAGACVLGCPRPRSKASASTESVFDVGTTFAPTRAR